MYRITEKIERGVVVIGAGGSGLVAAARAAQLSGLRVIVLEKTERIGGRAVYANFMRTFDSKWQKKRGLESRTADYIRLRQDSMRWRIDPELAAAAVWATGEFFDWMLEQYPELDSAFSEGKYVFPTKYDPIGPQTSAESDRNFGRIIVDSMSESCRKAGVDIRCGTRAVDIETEDGRVTGVIALSELGYTRIKCGACIVAAGSWVGNDEIVAKVCPGFDRRSQMKTPHIDSSLTGDGIAMAERAGAYIDKSNFCLRFIRTTGSRMDPELRALMRSPAPISVNMDGRRYCSEPVGRMDRFLGGAIQMAQPYGMSFTVMDENCLAAAIRLPPEEPDELEKSYGSCEMPKDVGELRHRIEEAARKDPRTVCVSESLNELADWMGVDKKAFLENVHRYNESCRAGADMEYLKKPEGLIALEKGPYYAIRSSAQVLGATGGVLVDSAMRAINRDRSGIIEGLYIAGDMASGGHVNEDGIGVRLLNELAWAVASGYIAGTKSAQQMPNKDE